jgi:two-component system phosphate regulon response regulator PhoB/two-component system alkaline phosphatase synthesis response regulator PhoP
MSKKIVIIEDEQILLRALNIELLSNGFEVLSAKDGESGLKLVREEKPGLVLLDLILPKMHGFEVLESLKSDETTKKIPVIILSNLGQKSDMKKGLEMGAEDYYVKASTDLSELSKKINRILT